MKLPRLEMLIAVAVLAVMVCIGVEARRNTPAQPDPPHCGCKDERCARDYGECNGCCSNKCDCAGNPAHAHDTSELP